MSKYTRNQSLYHSRHLIWKSENCYSTPSHFFMVNVGIPPSWDSKAETQPHPSSSAIGLLTEILISKLSQPYTIPQPVSIIPISGHVRVNSRIALPVSSSFKIRESKLSKTKVMYREVSDDVTTYSWPANQTAEQSTFCHYHSKWAGSQSIKVESWFRGLSHRYGEATGRCQTPDTPFEPLL